MKPKAVHQLMGSPARTKCGAGENRQWLRFRSMQITGTRSARLVTCKRCLKKTGS